MKRSIHERAPWARAGVNVRIFAGRSVARRYLSEGHHTVWCGCACPQCGRALAVEICVSGRAITDCATREAQRHESDVACLACGEYVGRAVAGER